MLQGKKIYKTTDGVTVCVIHYKDGIFHGTKENYDSKGMLGAVYEFNMGTYFGLSEYYWTDGITMCALTFDFI